MEVERVIRYGEEALQEAIEVGLQESLTLEFQGSNYFSDGVLTNDGRGGLAKVLSAFSNSAGGVIVIGVDSRKKEGVEVAMLQPLVSLERCLTSVNSALGELLQPR